MNDIETNIYPIENLNALNFSYDTYAVRNLNRNQDEYFQNRAGLVKDLSYKLGAPVEAIERNGEPFLVIPSDAANVPERVALVRAHVYLERVATGSVLDFTARNPESDAICLRVLNFMLQAPLWEDKRLWQPGAGLPFFEKNPTQEDRGIGHFRGFAARPVVAPSGTIGLCVDVRSKYVKTAPLAVRLDRMLFRSVKSHRCVYHYGQRWYEIRIEALSDLNVTKELIDTETGPVSLIDFITSHCEKPFASDLANLPADAAVLRYRDNRGRDRAVPAGLCYLVCDTQEDVARWLHDRAIIDPDKRREFTRAYVERYLRTLRFGNTALQTRLEPERIEQRLFTVPDLQFGGGQRLSMRGTRGANQVSLDALGKKRVALLRDPQAGFFVKERFRRQYLILPQSVAESWGERFVVDLTRSVDELYPDGGGYKPELITYKDRGPRTYRDQGRAILDAIRGRNLQSAFALVMLHHTSDRKLRDHDALAAMVVRELRRHDIYAAVNHSLMGEKSYAHVTGRDGNARYEVRENQRSRLTGYLRNVALNKILLTNNFWPFVLASPLHADVTLGIDVKNQTAAFSVIGGNGSHVRAFFQVSRQKEKLLKDQVATHVARILREERTRLDRPIASVVLHRDGRCYQSEIDGAIAAMEKLKGEGIVAADGSLTVLEISKSAPVRLRLFDVQRGHGPKPSVQNPQVGTYTIINGDEGFVCSTGRAFAHKGTVQPLHVQCVLEGMPFEHVLEDVYALTTLAWTRPEDCSRYPVTLKLTDRWLGEEASEFDEGVLVYEFDDGEPGEERATA